MFHDIGRTAGEIWKLLKEEGAMSPATIARRTKQPQAMVYMGIGWLAREDKLIFTQTKRGMSLSLKR